MTFFRTVCRHVLPVGLGDQCVHHIHWLAQIEQDLAMPRTYHNRHYCRLGLSSDRQGVAQACYSLLDTVDAPCLRLPLLVETPSTSRSNGNAYCHRCWGLWGAPWAHSTQARGAVAPTRLAGRPQCSCNPALPPRRWPPPSPQLSSLARIILLRFTICTSQKVLSINWQKYLVCRITKVVSNLPVMI